MSAPWVKSALPPMLGPLPGWTILPVPYLLLQFGKVSLSIFLITLFFSIYLTRKGRNLHWVIRRIKSALRANRIQSRPIGYRRRLSGLVFVNHLDFDRWRERSRANSSDLQD